VAHEYSDHRWVEIAAYGTAAAVSAARVAAQRHYLSDVLVGGALGYAIGRYVYFTHRRLEQAGADSPPPTGLRAFPSISAHFDRGAHGTATVAWTVR
jgi:membrane-associated phospholipid phosphatase